MKRMKCKGLKGVYYGESTLQTFNGKPDKVYHICYTHPHTGKNVWESVGWSSKGMNPNLAFTIRVDRMTNATTVKEPVLGPISLKEMFEMYRTKLEANDAKVGVAMRRARYFTTFFGEDRLSESIIPHDIDGWKKWMRDTPYSNSTISTALATFSAAWKVAVNARRITDTPDPVKSVEKPSVREDIRLRYLTEEEVMSLFKCCRASSENLYEICVFGLEGGMRAREITTLKWMHVNIQRGVLHLVDTKGKDNGVVYLSPRMKEILDRKKVGKPFDHVFTGRNGGTVEGLFDDYRACVNAVGLNAGVTDNRFKVVFHTLRHTFASWLAQKGVSLYVIKELMRHKKIEMTLRYAKLAPNNHEEAVSKLFGGMVY